VTSTEWTPAPAFSGRQVGQVLAGRYRLAMYKGGDDIAEVWHAVEEATQQVVTVEILRDRNDESRRTRFLEQAHRMAEIERPSVMKVAGIHDEPSDTFVVFEHLIPLPVELPDPLLAPDAVIPPPEAVAAPPPEAAAAPLPEWIATPLPETIAPPLSLQVAGPQPQPIAAVLPEWIAATQTTDAPTRVGATPLPEPVFETTPVVAATKPVVAETEPMRIIKPLTAKAPATVETEAVIVDLDDPSAPTVVMKPRAGANELSAITAQATRIVASARPLLRGLHLERLVAAAASRAQRLDNEKVGASAAQLALRARPVIAVARPLIASARPWIVRARHNQIVMAVLTAALVLAVFVVSPLDDAIASALRPRTTAAQSTITPAATLARASFALPPLSAYGAAFDSQAPFPTAVPNGAVEWVVALRNTGSAGWYRGIEGAQVSLALADGTGVAVQSTEYVAPGQVGWFVVHFRARAETGTYTVPLKPRVDGRGPLQDLGIHAIVTVAKP
jgi:hypothetical protein